MSIENEMKNYIGERLKQINMIAEELEYKSKILDLDEVEVPTVLISIGENNLGDDIVVSCNLIPIAIEEVPVLFLQFYMCVSNKIPEDKIDLVNEYIKRQNEVFMIGNLLNFSDTVCLKYGLYLDVDDDLDAALLSRSLDIFIFEANIFASKVFSLVSGKYTIDELLEQGTFSFE